MYRKWISTVLFCIGLWTQAAFSATTDIRTSVKHPTGIAIDELATAVYFVESDTGTLYRIDITPGCNATTPCTTTAIVNQLKSAQDVALDSAHNYAYVTSIDPLLNGALWRVDLAAKTQKLITFNFGQPRQLTLDVATQTAYVTGTDTTNIGRLWKVNLTTGGKRTVITGLNAPTGLTILADRTRAYVTESNGNLAEIDIALGTRTRNISTGLNQPRYLAWTDTMQTTLYGVQRGTTSLVRADIPSISTATAFTAIGTAANPPLGIAVNSFAGVAYVTTDDKIIRVDLLNLDMTNPGFISVGGVTKSDIQGGYANNSYFKDSPFGGTLSIFGNLSFFASVPSVTHYRVMVSYNGQTPQPVKSAWTVSRWDNASLKWTPYPVAPEGDGYYRIPSEYYKNPTAQPERFSPPFLMLQWPSGAYGDYTFTIELYQFVATPQPAWNPKTPAQIAAEKLTLRVDNEPLTVDLTSIFQHSTGALIQPCQIVNGAGPTGKYDMFFTASDPQGHLRSYDIVAYWGKNKSAVVLPTVSYVPPTDGTRKWYGASNQKGPANGYTPACNCAHMFVLTAWKRSTNGYSYLIQQTSHLSITVNDTGSTSCQ